MDEERLSDGFEAPDLGRAIASRRAYVLVVEPSSTEPGGAELAARVSGWFTHTALADPALHPKLTVVTPDAATARALALPQWVVVFDLATDAAALWRHLGVHGGASPCRCAGPMLPWSPVLDLEHFDALVSAAAETGIIGHERREQRTLGLPPQIVQQLPGCDRPIDTVRGEIGALAGFSPARSPAEAKELLKIWLANAIALGAGRPAASIFAATREMLDAPDVAPRPPSSFWQAMSPHHWDHHAVAGGRCSGHVLPRTGVFILTSRCASCDFRRVVEEIIDAEGVDFEAHLIEVSQSDPMSSAAQFVAQLSSLGRPFRHVILVGFGAGEIAARHATTELLCAAVNAAPRLGPDQRARETALRIRQVRLYRTDPSSIDDPRLVDAIARLRQQQLPYPAIRTTHIDLPTSDYAALAVFVREDLRHYLFERRWLVMRETVAQSYELDCTAGVDRLIAPLTPVEPLAMEPAGTRQLSTRRAHGAQREIFEIIDSTLGHAPPQPRRTVLTGDAGVGKSTLLHHVARAVSLAGLACEPAGRLVVFVPLYFVTLGELPCLDKRSPREQGEVLLELLLRWLCRWFDGMTFSGAIAVDWLRDIITRGECVVILDGVDEFVTNHAALGLVHVQRMLEVLAPPAAASRPLDVVLGVRNTQLDHAQLAHQRGAVLTLDRLTLPQARQHFPIVEALEERVGAALLEGSPVVLTPLVLAQLDDTMIESLAERAACVRTEVLNAALVSIIGKSNLLMIDSTCRQESREDWLVALSVIAWAMHASVRADIRVVDLCAAVRATMSRWEGYAKRAETRQSDAVRRGFSLVLDDAARGALLNRSVLYPTGGDGVRFMHREWLDYLTAYYFALCIRHRAVDELGLAAFTVPIYVATGEMIRGLVIEAEDVDLIMERGAGPMLPLVKANYLALLGNAPVEFSGPALQRLFADLPTMSPVSRLVTITGFGTRLLRRFDRDGVFPVVLGLYCDAMRDCLAQSSIDAISRSLAWCYLAALASAASTEPPPRSAFVDLGAAESHEHDALAVVSEATSTGRVLSTQTRSVQMSFVQIQSTVAMSMRPISVVHYLYVILVAFKHRLHVDEVARALPAIFADGSAYEAEVERFTLVPELARLFAQQRRLFLAETTPAASDPSRPRRPPRRLTLP